MAARVATLVITAAAIAIAAALPQKEQLTNPRSGSAEAIAEGRTLFRSSAGNCHGIDARGGTRGPDLTRASPSTREPAGCSGRTTSAAASMPRRSVTASAAGRTSRWPPVPRSSRSACPRKAGESLRPRSNDGGVCQRHAYNLVIGQD
jgi:mono/diheme cytochrome c family protein